MATEDVPGVTESIIEASNDEVVTADEPSDEIKPQNREKVSLGILKESIQYLQFQCDKCLKGSFRFRHPNFCQKCVVNNFIDADEQENIDNIIKCRKCTKPKFR